MDAFTGLFPPVSGSAESDDRDLDELPVSMLGLVRDKDVDNIRTWLTSTQELYNRVVLAARRRASGPDMTRDLESIEALNSQLVTLLTKWSHVEKVIAGMPPPRLRVSIAHQEALSDVFSIVRSLPPARLDDAMEWIQGAPSSMNTSALSNALLDCQDAITAITRLHKWAEHLEEWGVDSSA